MLHILNGDCVAGGLRLAGVPGEFLPWRELFMEGPVAPDPYTPEMLAARAACLDQLTGLPADLYTRGIHRQLQTLRDFRRHEEVILWFEYDLFDQTILTYLLHWFAGQDLGNTRLNMICLREFPGIAHFMGLGQLTPVQLAGLYGTQQPVSAAQLTLGRRAWEAYASPDPTAIEALLGGDTSALPCLEDSFRSQLARFPSRRNGLGRIENEVLAFIAAGKDRFVPLFTEVSANLSFYGFGDTQLWLYLERLRGGAHPLLRIEGPQELPRFSLGPNPPPNPWRFELTSDGQAVLAGTADAARLNGCDWWLGGVHLHGFEPEWRWDEERQQLIRA